MGSVAKGEDPATARAQWRAADTFEGLTQQWVDAKRRQGRAASYLKRSEERLAILPESFRAMKACDVKRVHVTAALDDVAERGAKIETNRQQALISAVFKWGVSEGLLDHDPSQGVKRRFDEEARERVFTDAEVKAFWDGVGGAAASPGAKIAMRLCFVLGQRPKEIAHMRKDKLALDGLKEWREFPHPFMTIEKTTAKNRTESRIPLPALAIELIRDALRLLPDAAGDDAGAAEGSEGADRDGRWLFPNPTGDGPIDPHAFAKIIHRARDPKTKAVFGIKDAQLYDAKKTIATFLGDNGYPDQFIGLLFGHLTAKSGTVTGKHYNHSRYMQQKREMIELWARHLEGVLGIVRPASSTVVPLRAHASKSA